MMEAGKELDALVAEKVMGIKTEVLAKPSGPFKLFRLDEKYLYENAAPYSTNISAAWLVVEKLKEIHSVNIFTTHIHGPEETEILIDGVSRAKGDLTIPRAICLASLKVYE